MELLPAGSSVTLGISAASSLRCGGSGVDSGLPVQLWPAAQKTRTAHQSQGKLKGNVQTPDSTYLLAAQTRLNPAANRCRRWLFHLANTQSPFAAWHSLSCQNSPIPNGDGHLTAYTTSSLAAQARLNPAANRRRGWLFHFNSTQNSLTEWLPALCQTRPSQMGPPGAPITQTAHSLAAQTRFNRAADRSRSRLFQFDNPQDFIAASLKAPRPGPPQRIS